MCRERVRVKVPALIQVASSLSLLARGRRWARWPWPDMAWTRRCGPASASTRRAARFCSSSRCVSPREGSVLWFAFCFFAASSICLFLRIIGSSLYQDSGMTEWSACLFQRKLQIFLLFSRNTNCRFQSFRDPDIATVLQNKVQILSKIFPRG